VLSGTAADGLRFGLAKSLGFDELINVEEADVVEQVRTVTGGCGRMWSWNARALPPRRASA